MKRASCLTAQKVWTDRKRLRQEVETGAGCGWDVQAWGVVCCAEYWLAGFCGKKAQALGWRRVGPVRARDVRMCVVSEVRLRVRGAARRRGAGTGLGR